MSESTDYELLDSGIHYYKWRSSTFDAFQAYFQHSRQIILQKKKENPDEIPHLLMLLDFSRITLPSLKDIVNLAVDVRRQEHFPKDSVSRKVAYLSDDPDLSEKLDSIAPLTSALNTHEFFDSSQQEDAIAWLLDQTPN